MTMKMLHLPTICIAVAPSCCTMTRPMTLRTPAQSMFSNNAAINIRGSREPSPSTEATPNAAATRHRQSSSKGGRNPPPPASMMTVNARSTPGVCQSRSCIGERMMSSRLPGEADRISVRSAGTVQSRAWPRSSSLGAGGAEGALRRTALSTTTVFKARKNMAAKDSAKPRIAPESAFVTAAPAACKPPSIVQQPPRIVSPTAVQARRLRRAPKHVAKIPVKAGVMLPRTAFRPGSMRPRDALFAATEIAMVNDTGRIRRM
mmetsp:Transcript_87839/g.253337  ORF Transcript_87839/g.253337 Transcript_87839/m.253337 type:complete len:261 (-) Transcript_87839:348-1130(-)